MRMGVVTLAFALSVATSGVAGAVKQWPTDRWPVAKPESQGFDSGKLAEALSTIRELELDIHSLLIVRDGKIILDAYFYPYDGTTPHNVASVTKSVMTTLTAIAAEQGRLGLDEPALSYFPGRTIANRDGLKERITIRHLTEMASGFDCLAEPDEPTLHEMNESADWVQFTLDLKMAAEPGTEFVYCSPGMHLLSAIVQEAAGETASAFAEHHLFGPLGISDFIWPQDPQGYSTGWGDLHLHPHDMARFGYLWLHGGEWNGKRIVSRDWVTRSSSLQKKTGGEDDYGYGWWIMTGDAVPQYSAVGRGGQRVAVFPTLDAVIVTTGAGFEPATAFDLIGTALIDPGKALPVNPAGEASLAAALAALAAPPAPRDVGAPPETAVAVSGLTYVFEANPLHLDGMRVDFDSGDEATLTLMFAGQPARVGRIGLDGVYRFSPGENGLPVGIRGGWADATTFLVEYDTIASIDAFDLRVRYDGDRVVVDAKDRTYQSGVRLVGKVDRSTGRK